MTPEQIASRAKQVLDDPVFQMVTAEIEKSAVNALAYADAQDHDKRQAKAAEIRAIRSLVNQLKSLSISTVERKPPTVA